MIVLTANQSLSLLLSTTPVANGPVVSVSYTDTGGAVPGELTEIISNTSTFTICSGPASNTQSRMVSSINIYNQDTSPATLLIGKVNSNSNSYPLKKATLSPGFTLTYTSADGWETTDTNGALQSNFNNQLSYSGWKNKLLNPQFTFFQRANTSGFVTSLNAYVADKWKCQTLNANVNFTVAPVSNFTNQQIAGLGSAYLNVISNTASNSTCYTCVTQFIEDITLLAGKTCTFTFYGYDNQPTPPPVLVEFGQYVAPGASANGTAWYNTGAFTQNVAISNTFTTMSVTGTFPTVNANSYVSANVSQTASYVTIWIDAGSSKANNTGLSGGITPSNRRFNVVWAQLEVGTVSTALEIRPLATELQMCQRYYEKTYDLNVVPGTNNVVGYQQTYLTALPSNTQTIALQANFKVQKRTAPSFTPYSYNTGASGKINFNGTDVTPTTTGAATGSAVLNASDTAASTTINAVWHWTAEADF
jgi:hypothetical protein